MLSQQRKLSHAQAIIALGVGLAVAVLFVAFRQVSNTPTTPLSSPGVPYGIAPVPGQGPFAGEGQRHVSLAEAVSSAPYHLYRPADSLASDKTVTDVWTAVLDVGKDGEFNVAIDYQSGLTIMVKPVELPDPVVAFHNIVEEDGVGYVTTIQGSPALVIPQDSDGTGADPGSIDMVVNGIQISIIGHLSEEDLLRIARSIT